MKNIILFTFTCISLGLFAVWIVRPSTSDTETNNDAPSARSAIKSNGNSIRQTRAKTRKRRADTKMESSGGDNISEHGLSAADREAIKRRNDRHLIDARDTNEFKIKNILAELELNADQEKLLRAYLGGLQFGMDAMNGDGLAKAMSEHLTEEQKEALATMQQRHKRKKSDGIALQNLSKILPVLDLNDGQREEVYNILAEDAEMTLGKEIYGDGSTSSQVDSITHNALRQLSKLAMNSDIDADRKVEQQKEITTQMNKGIAQLIDGKVERMSGTLNENQLKQYRNYLESKVGMIEGVMTE